ncbi:MAG: ABC transporter substrate-binding protein [Planctomycetota bacterium]
MKHPIRLAGALVAVGLLAWLVTRSCSASSSTPTAVSLTSSKNLWCTLPIIAREKGFFADQGLEVSIDFVQAAKFAMDALIAGSTEFATVVEVNVAYLGFTGNDDVRIISTIADSYDGAITARSDSGIQNPADLRGKRLGILQGTTSQFFAERFLEKHGLSSKDVDVRNLQPVAIQSAIVEKAIDAGSLWQPFTHNIAQALKGQVKIFSDRDVYTGYMNIAVGKAWSGLNDETVQKFLRALIKAEAFVKANPDESQQIMARVVNLDLSTVQAIWGQYAFTLYLDSSKLESVIADEARWIRATQRGFDTKSLPDYKPYMTSEYLDAARR